MREGPGHILSSATDNKIHVFCVHGHGKLLEIFIFSGDGEVLERFVIVIFKGNSGKRLLSKLNI